MNKDLTYRKSTLGSEAIAKRQPGLGPKQRSMLILIDGKKGFDELSRLSAMLGDAAQLMQELESAGLIEPVSQAAPAAAGGAPAMPVAPAATAALPLPEAKRFAVRLLTDTLGPMAEELCIAIEGTRTAADFMNAVNRAEGLLRQVKGAEAARQFNAAVAAHRPAG